MAPVPGIRRSATAGLYLFWDSMSFSGTRSLLFELGFVDFELLDAPVLGVLERLATGGLGASPSGSSCAGGAHVGLRH